MSITPAASASLPVALFGALALWWPVAWALAS
jgi:hypothetical protein